MKKKFVLVLALVLLVATAAFAGDVKFSGEYKGGYTFTFADTNKVEALNLDKGYEGKLVLKVVDTDGIWDVTFKGVADKSKLNTKTYNASANVDFAKALATKDVKLDGWTLKLGLSNSTISPLSVYKDTYSTYDDGLGNVGTNTVAATVGYKGFTLFGGFSPVDNQKSGIVSLKYAYEKGISAAAGYVIQNTKQSHLIASVDVDIKKLASMDFDLGVSVADWIGLEHKTNSVRDAAPTNYLYAEVYGGAKNIMGYAEFAMKSDDTSVSDSTVSMLKTRVAYSGIKDMGLRAEYYILNFKDVGKNQQIKAQVTYKLAGVKYGLDCKYDTSNSSFSLNPWVDITF